MQLTCSHCAIIITTMEILPEKGLADISNQFVKHFNEKHPGESRQMAKELMELQAIVVWLVMIAKHTTLLDQVGKEDDPIMNKFDEIVDRVEDILGIEVIDTRSLEVTLVPNKESEITLATSPVEPLIKL